MMIFRALLRRVSLRVSLVVVCAMALAGCSTTGSSFDTSALRFIVPGQTTLDEASSLLNSDPTDVYRQLDGSALARWSHKTSVVTDAIYLNQELWLAFGPDGRFQKIQKSVNLPRANMYDSGVRVDAPPSTAHTVSSAVNEVPAAASNGGALSYPTAVPNTGAPVSTTNSATTPGAMYKPAVSYPLSP